MARLTDEEAEALDEYYTKNPPVPGPRGSGFFTRRRQSARSITVDNVAAAWLYTKALADHKTPADIIGELVREQIRASTGLPAAARI